MSIMYIYVYVYVYVDHVDVYEMVVNRKLGIAFACRSVSEDNVSSKTLEQKNKTKAITYQLMLVPFSR